MKEWDSMLGGYEWYEFYARRFESGGEWECEIYIVWVILES